MPPQPAREWRNRKQFGPDAKPGRNRGPKARPKTEMKRKGPIPEKRGGQFFGDDEEDYINNNNDMEAEDFGRFLREDGLEEDQE
jgi:hypothetical protein